MSLDRQISEAVRTIAGTNNAENLKVVLAEVLSVNESKRTCNVLVTGKSEYQINDVSLMVSVEDGLFVVPDKNSQVYVCYNNRNIKFICQFSKTKKVLLVTDNSSVEFKEDSIKFNDGSYNGLVKIDDLTDKLNAMVRAINIELTKIKAGITAGGGSYTITSLQTLNKSDYENDKITHG